MKKFQIKTVALYAKNRYQRSGDIWADVIKCLEADGYTPDNKSDVVEILTNQVTDKLYYLQHGPHYLVRNLLSDIRPENCWKVGYYTKDHNWVKDDFSNVTYDYDTAILYWYLSNLRNIPIDSLGELGDPDPNVLPVINKYQD